METTVKYYASDGKAYDTAEEAIKASRELPSATETVLKLMNEAVFNLEGGTDAKMLLRKGSTVPSR